jgi:hypothetical protein
MRDAEVIDDPLNDLTALVAESAALRCAMHALLHAVVHRSEPEEAIATFERLAVLWHVATTEQRSRDCFSAAATGVRMKLEVAKQKASASR